MGLPFICVVSFLSLTLIFSSGCSTSKDDVPETETSSSSHIPILPNGCPEGFIGVPHLKGYTDNDFCVAKYEMKNGGTDTEMNTDDDRATSQPRGIPWVEISRGQAIEECQKLGEGFDLINNSEWQTIARNIELVEENWSENLVGEGSLNQGNISMRSDITSIIFSTDEELLAASSDDDEACYQLGIKSMDCSGEIWHKQKRTHILAHGEVIWDMGGNAAEIIKDDYTTTHSDQSSSDAISQVSDTSHPYVVRLSDGSVGSFKDQFGPEGDYQDLDSGDFGGLGDLSYDMEGGTGILRGGSYHLFNSIYLNLVGFSVSHPSPGIFSARLEYEASYREDFVGFRCVYHPY